MDLVSFKDAKATGLKFYFTGKPCMRGHLSVRRVKGCGCVQCQQVQKRTSPKNNPDRVKTNARNGKQKRKNVPGKHTAQDIAAIIKLQKGKCAYCKVKLGKKRHIDHIVPVSKGGTNDRQNLQITCIPCNLTKGARDPIFHAQTLGMLL